MHIRPVLAGAVPAFLCLLSAATARATTTVTIDAPTSQIVQTTSLAVRATASSTDGVYLVEAEFEGSVVELAPTSDGHYEGTIDVGALAYGPHALTVYAYDLFGDAVSAVKTLYRYTPPTISLQSPKAYDTITGYNSRALLASCVPTPPLRCAKLTAVFLRANNSFDWSSTTASASGRIDLYTYLNPDPYGGGLRSGEQFTIEIIAEDYLGPIVTKTVGPIYVEASPKLAVVQRAPGAILDFDAARILFLAPQQQLGVLDRATQQVTWIATLPQDPATATQTYGALTPSGAVFQSLNGAIFKWVSGTLSFVATGRLDAVNGDTLVWTRLDEDQGVKHTISTGVGSTLWASPGSLSPFQADITASGGVYYGTYDEPGIRGPGRFLGNHPGNLQRPITDGTNVLGRWWNGSTSSSYLYTPGGTEIFLGDSRSGNSAGLLVHDGYAAFLRSAGVVNQVWSRSPAGDLQQLSAFATSSQFDQQKLRVGHDGISDAGEVMFLNDHQRYLGRSGAAPEAISTDLGHARWFGGAWYTTVGNTLLRATPAGPPAASPVAPVAMALRPAPQELEAIEAAAAAARGDDDVRIAEVPAWESHEPDALPGSIPGDAIGGALRAKPRSAADLSEEAAELAEDEDVAAAGCRVDRSARTGSGGFALAAAVAGLVVARRRRRGERA